MKKIFILCLVASTMLACGKKIEKLVDLKSLKKEGESIATTTQNALMSNVATAIEKGGTTYGVAFCSTKSLELTDSLSKKHEVTIQRITDKNRNKNNALTTSNDITIFNALKENTKLQDSLITENGKHIYYKRIDLGMETCLKCHGTPGSNINTETLAKIKEHYPFDYAVGYNLKDLRGMWKITFEE